MESHIHVVSKHNNGNHAVLPFPGPALLAPLAASSIRVRTTLITLSSNNLTYARNGDTLAWWSTWPIPPSAPPPYNDPGAWGIVPAWGYATVLESTIPAIPADSTLYGFWLTASHPVDLQLRATEPSGHWIETSPHRQRLMSLYNHYFQATLPAAASTTNDLALKVVWQCGYLASRFVFPGSPRDADVGPVHPLGIDLPWTAADADLSRAVVVSLSASSKTGRGFAWNVLRNRPRGAGPLALLQATSAPGALKSWEKDGDEGRVPAKAVGYGELCDRGTVEWVRSFGPRRVVVLDFGARKGVLEGFLGALNESGGAEVFEFDVVVVAVGAEMKVYSDEDMEGVKASMEKLKKVQFNTSGVKDRAIEVEGAENYHRNLDETWERCRDESGMGEFETVRVEGVEGIKSVWQDLCEQKVRPDQAVIATLF